MQKMQAVAVVMEFLHAPGQKGVEEDPAFQLRLLELLKKWEGNTAMLETLLSQAKTEIISGTHFLCKDLRTEVGQRQKIDLYLETYPFLEETLRRRRPYTLQERTELKKLNAKFISSTNKMKQLPTVSERASWGIKNMNEFVSRTSRIYSASDPIDIAQYRA